MRYLRFDPENAEHEALRPRIAALEQLATYPLGADSFKISHGDDYFAFFSRLGKLHYYLVLDGSRVVAVAAGVLRPRPRPSWYLCDLKVHPEYRGRHLPLKLLTRVFVPRYLECRRGYAISMNPGDGSPNRIVRMLGHFRWLSSALATTLELFSLDEPALRASLDAIERHRGKVSYLSLAGIKDIVLTSTGAPMRLAHVQFGPCSARAGDRGHSPEPLPGHVHMLCAPRGDALAVELRGRGLVPSATASVIHHRMADTDWGFVLTSDI
jgi:hypothetical protein